MTSIELSDSARLRLHPLRITRFGDEHYSVIRRGGRREVATRAVGVEALRRFQAGDSIGETRRWLAERFETRPEAVKLEPLIQVLLGADLVARLDGVAIETPRVGVQDLVRFHLRFETLPRLVRATRRLPLPIARPLLRRLFGQMLEAPCRRKVRRAGASFERIFPGAAPGRRGAFEREYFDHLVWNVVDLEALRNRPLEQIEGWLDAFVRLEGVEVFEWARRQGRGVLLSGFHFSSNRLLPVALMRRGYSLLSMGAISIGWGAQATKNQLASWCEARPSYGALELVENLDLGSVNRLVEALRQGGTVLTMPDVYSLSTFEDSSVAERARYFGIVRSRFPRATLPVRFFDHWIDVNPWGGWLAAVSRPVVLPVLIERTERHLVCRFGEPLDPPEESGSKARMNKMTEKLFERLQAEVERCPAQWFGWHNLDKLNPRPVLATGREESTDLGEDLVVQPSFPKDQNGKEVKRDERTGSGHRGRGAG